LAVQVSEGGGFTWTTQVAYTSTVEFIETPLFTRLVGGYLEDSEYRDLQLSLAVNPEAGAVIPGAGGCRKLRWTDKRRGKGKRGGLRVIYCYLVEDMQIWLLTLYGKEEAVDLTSKEKRLLKAAIEEETRQRSRFRRLKRE
jgi:hypothetical protein